MADLTPLAPESPRRPRHPVAPAVSAAAALRGALRVAVVRDAHVVEERLLSGDAAAPPAGHSELAEPGHREPGRVTVGPSAPATFVVPGAGLSAEVPLFVRVGGHYHLAVSEHTRGRLAQGGRVTELEALHAGAAAMPGGALLVPLAADARGRVQLGQVSFLFQGVAVPSRAAAPAPATPSAPATAPAAEVDWATTFIAACSFLLHFMAIGVLASDWLDRPIDDDVAVARAAETLHPLPAPPPLEVHDEAAPVPSVERMALRPAPAGRSAGGAAPRGGAAAEGSASLVSRLEALELATLGALGAAGPATDAVLRGSRLPTEELDRATRSDRVTGPGGFMVPGSGSAVAPGAGPGGLEALAEGRRTLTGGGELRRELPPASADVGPPSTPGDTPLPGAPRVVAGLRAGFRACYQQGLAEHPDAQGNIQLSLAVGPAGEVTSVSASVSGNLPGSVVACVRRRAQMAQFEAPIGGAAVVRVPVTLIRQ